MCASLAVFKRHRRWLIGGAVGIAVLFVAGFATIPLLRGKMESRFAAKLREDGIAIYWSDSSWGLWRGLELRKVRVQVIGSKEPFLEAGNLQFQVTLREYLGLADTPRYWRIADAPVILRDAQGDVALERVSLQVVTHLGRIEVRDFRATKDGLQADLHGSIVQHPRTGPTTDPYPVPLEAVRTTLHTLAIQGGPLVVKGEFSADRTQSSLEWKAHLKGDGRNLTWQGVPCSNAAASADISSQHSTIQYQLRNPQGWTEGTMTREDWSNSPLTFEGRLIDPAGVADSYAGRFFEHVFTVSRLRGSANLCTIADGIPALAGHCPKKIRFKEFPEIDARNIRRKTGAETWTLESATVRSEEATFVLDEDEIEARDLTGEVSYDGEAWTISESRAKLLGGAIAASGRLHEGKFSKAAIEIEDVRTTSLANATGHELPKKFRGKVSGTFHGSIDFKNDNLNGKGSLHMDGAPVIEVPLLDQAGGLFKSTVPDMESPKEGRFEADFEADDELVKVHRFEAEGGTVTVSAKGIVNLQKERVSGTARGKLTGLPGVVTAPLSRLLEMEIEGPFDDIQIKPLGPAKLVSNAASATVGTPIDEVGERAKVSGTVVKESIKLPWHWIKKKQAERKGGSPRESR